MQAHNLQRLHRLHASMRTKKDKEAAQQAVWEARYKVRAAETERKKHEDSLAFFQVTVALILPMISGNSHFHLVRDTRYQSPSSTERFQVTVTLQ